MYWPSGCAVPGKAYSVGQAEPKRKLVVGSGPRREACGAKQSQNCSG